jgi:hypothetical protein
VIITAKEASATAAFLKAKNAGESKDCLRDLRDLFASPTPLTSTLCGLLTLIAAGAIYAAFHLRRGQKLKEKAGESGWDKFIVWSRKVDHAIVDNANAKPPALLERLTAVQH